MNGGRDWLYYYVRDLEFHTTCLGEGVSVVLLFRYRES